MRGTFNHTIIVLPLTLVKKIVHHKHDKRFPVSKLCDFSGIKNLALVAQFDVFHSVFNSRIKFDREKVVVRVIVIEKMMIDL